MVAQPYARTYALCRQLMNTSIFSHMPVAREIFPCRLLILPEKEIYRFLRQNNKTTHTCYRSSEIWEVLMNSGHLAVGRNIIWDVLQIEIKVLVGGVIKE